MTNTPGSEEPSLASRLEKIEARLERIEGAVYLPPAGAGAAAQAPAPTPRVEPPPFNPPGRPAAPAQQGSHPLGFKLETGHFLGALAVLFFVLAASYLVKLALDSGWLTPERQWGGAMALGALLIGLGCAFRKRDEIYFSLLPGAGVVVCFMAAYAGHLRYQLYGPMETLALLVLVSLASLGLYSLFRQVFYVITAMLGTYLVPCLVPALGSDGLALRPYFICWDLVLCVLSIAVRLRPFIFLAAYLGLGIFAISLQPFRSGLDAEGAMDALIFQGVQFFFFAGATLLYSLINQVRMSAEEAWSALPVLVFFYGLEYYLAAKAFPGFAAWLALGYSVFILGLYSIARRWLGTQALDSGPMISGYLALVWFHAGYLRLLPQALQPALGLILALALPWGWIRMNLSRHWLLALFLMIVVFLEYGRVLVGLSPLERMDSCFWNMGFAAVMLGIGLMARRSQEFPGQPAVPALLLVFAHIQAMAGLVRLIHEPGVASSTFAVSASWGIYGLALVGLGRLLKDPVLARSALAVFMAAVLKSLLIDLWSVAGFSRVLAFLGMGTCLYLAGLMFRHIGNWDSRARA